MSVWMDSDKARRIGEYCRKMMKHRWIVMPTFAILTCGPRGSRLTINRLGILVEPGGNAHGIDDLLAPHLGPDHVPIDALILWPRPRAETQQLDGELVRRLGIRHGAYGGHKDVFVDEGPGVIVVGDEGDGAGGVEGRADGRGDAAALGSGWRGGGVCALSGAEGGVCPGPGPGEVEHGWWVGIGSEEGE